MGSLSQGRLQLLAIAGILGLSACSEEDKQTGAEIQGKAPANPIGRLDESQVFFYPHGFEASGEKRVLAETSAGKLDSWQLQRYQAALGPGSNLEELIFDFLLTAECRSRRIGGAAPLLARSAAAQRFLSSGRQQEAGDDRQQQRKFANQALRKNRVDAIARADRSMPDAAVRALFERRFGPGGQRRRVQQVLVSFKATAEGLRAAGEAADRPASKTAARLQAETFRMQAIELGSLAALQDPERHGSAGVLWDTELQRLGTRITGPLSQLEEGAISEPLESRVGFHLFQVLEILVTEYAEVEDSIRQELLLGPASESEIRDLRQSLREKYELRLIR
ncbi:MAG: peptidylprolyl isomerase [Planctomycetota bacterium]|jgi:hypothetical protein